MSSDRVPRKQPRRASRRGFATSKLRLRDESDGQSAERQNGEGGMGEPVTEALIDLGCRVIRTLRLQHAADDVEQPRCVRIRRFEIQPLKNAQAPGP